MTLDFQAVQTPKYLVDAMREHRKMTQDELFQQKVSFVYGSLDHKSDMTKADVERIILEHDGRTTEAA